MIFGFNQMHNHQEAVKNNKLLKYAKINNLQNTNKNHTPKSFYIKYSQRRFTFEFF